MEHTQNLNVQGSADAPVLVICDATGQETYQQGRVMPIGAMDVFGTVAQANGFSVDDFSFVTVSPPVPEAAIGSAKREGEFVQQFNEELWSVINASQCRMVVYLGSLAGRGVMGRPVQIMKGRGQVVRRDGFTKPILPLLSPLQVIRRPDTRETFETDFKILARLRDSGWDTSVADSSTRQANYSWRTDISDLLANPPRSLALDTETIGYEWFRGAALLTIQMSWEEGASIVLPVHTGYWEMFTGTEAFNAHVRTLQAILDEAYAKGQKTSHRVVDRDAAWAAWRQRYPDLGGDRGRFNLMRQVRELLANPRVAVTGHNLKYDVHALRNENIEIANWFADTMQLAFSVDENMQEKSLDECTRRWIPVMAGYADVFNKKWDKGRMDLIPPDELLPYAGGDTDAAFRLTRYLLREVRKDSRQLATYQDIQMPALRAFSRMERYGVGVNQQQLQDLGTTLQQMETRTFDALIEHTPPQVKRRHIDAGMKFSRAAFTSDILFSPDGFGLRPLVFTKGSTPDQRIPSVSAKTHLPFFADFRTGHWAQTSTFDQYIHELSEARQEAAKAPLTPEEVAQERRNGFPYIAKLIEYSKLQKLRTTYVGQQGLTEAIAGGRNRIVAPSGFWQYIAPDGRIHPSFFLHDTVTGRSSSRNPNAQNFPKRGKMAKAFRKIFKPTPGFVFVEADLSQAELRIAAWMAMESTMLDVYQRDGDIHTATAATILGVSVEQFAQLDKSQRDLYRFYAKAVNFGFLYGMGWRKFKDYAKTEYGVDFTDEQAQELREKFFRLYPNLQNWHAAMRDFVKRHGYVRSLHGAMRHLPQIHSPDEKIKGEAERQAINSPVQRFASDLGLMAMARLARDTDWDVVRPLMFIHDALVCEVREDIAEQAGGWIKFYMETPPLARFGLTAPLPIRSDVSIGPDLGSMDERKGMQIIVPPFYNAALDG